MTLNNETIRRGRKCVKYPETHNVLIRNILYFYAILLLLYI